MRIRRRSVVSMVVATMLVSGCSDAEEPNYATVPPIDTTPLTTETRSSTSTSSTVSVTSSSSSVSTTVAGPVRLTPEDLGPLVEPARLEGVPGMPVPGEVVELLPMVWMYLPSVFDQSDPSVIPPAPEHADVLAAYARARAAVVAQLTQPPVAAEPSPAVQATHADGGAAVRVESFDKRSAEGTYAAFPDGRPTVYRPYVVQLSSTEALIYDCSIEGGRLVDANGNNVSNTDILGLPPYGFSTEMVKVDGVWLVETKGFKQEAACQ
jgi:hypothetical protein